MVVVACFEHATHTIKKSSTDAIYMVPVNPTGPCRSGLTPARFKFWISVTIYQLRMGAARKVS